MVDGTHLLLVLPSPNLGWPWYLFFSCDHNARTAKPSGLRLFVPHGDALQLCRRKRLEIPLPYLLSVCPMQVLWLYIRL